MDEIFRPAHIEEPLKEESIGTSPNCDNKPAAPSEDQSLLDKYDDLDLLNDYE
jgi:hypothetical protein